MNAITLTTKVVLSTSLIFLPCCTWLAPLADDVTEMVNNDAIIIKVDKDAFAKDTDVNISVDVLNKEVPAGISVSPNIPAVHY